MATSAKTAEPRTEVVAKSTTKVGNLTRDPELRFGQNGTAFSRTGLAVNRPKVQDDWRGEQVTEFYEVTCFGTVAEHAAECLGKGMRVVVVGRGEIEHWTDDTGTTRSTKRIVAKEVSPSLRWAKVSVERVARDAPKSSKGSEEDMDEEPF